MSTEPTRGVSPGGVLRRIRLAEHPRGTLGETGKKVAEDVSVLVRAELELAKAEIMGAVQSKMAGAGLLFAAGVLAFLAFQGLLITLGFVLAEVAGLPGWASALIVTGVLVLIAVILVLVGKRMLATEVSAEQATSNVKEDVATAKEHLRPAPEHTDTEPASADRIGQ